MTAGATVAPRPDTARPTAAGGGLPTATAVSYTHLDVYKRQALDGYIALYTEVSSATEDHPFDFATYDQRVKDIQDTYDQGIESLQAGDGKAVSL